jgi:hypothetical protein
MRVGLRGLHRPTAHLERQRTGGVHDLLREIDLEMAHDLAPGLAPPTYRRVVRVLQQLAAGVQHLVEGPVAPSGKRDAVGHRSVLAVPNPVFGCHL